MQTKLRMSFLGVSPTQAIESAIQREMASLERYSDRIIACHVSVAEPHKRHRQGNHYSVTIDLVVPGEELVINDEHPHEDPYLAVREAFHLMRRILEDYVRRIRGAVKAHAQPQTASSSAWASEVDDPEFR